MPTAPTLNTSSTPVVQSPAYERFVLVALFALALALNLFLTTRNWHSGLLAGQEFRQTQTAISSFFIQRENNFSVDYPTPVLGKPWSIPMEYPLYQWGAVRISNATGWPLAESGRTLTLVCFYLTLPALYLLLGQMGLPPRRRLAGLALMLTCPAYIFYSRAFLIESMALMFSVWFLTAFIRTMQTRRLAWLALTALAGTGAGLVKITTFMAWMLPAVGYGLYLVWRDWPRGPRGWRPLLTTLAWGAACAAVPCGVSTWWVHHANAVKAANLSGAFLTSEALHIFNAKDWFLRVSPEIWRMFAHNWRMAIMPPGLMVLGALAALVVARLRSGWPLAAIGLFFAPHLVFPILFSVHDYYFYAIALFWLIAIAMAAHALASHRLGRWLALPLLLVTVGGQLAAYRSSYFAVQAHVDTGGSHLTAAIRDLTPADSVIVIAGEDWSSILPYYAQRRALMVREPVANDGTYLHQALGALAGEDVSALVLIGPQRENRQLIDIAAQTLAIDPAVCFSHEKTDVYISSYHRPAVVRHLQQNNNYGTLKLVAHDTVVSTQVRPVPEGLAETIFRHFSPKPTHASFSIGLNLSQYEGQEVLGAHPDATLWITPPARARRIEWEFGIFPGAYEREGLRTNGVEFILNEELADGTITRELYRRLLDPAVQAGDRGLQTLRLDYAPRPGTHLTFMTRTNGDSSYDWAYWRQIQVR